MSIYTNSNNYHHSYLSKNNYNFQHNINPILSYQQSSFPASQLNSLQDTALLCNENPKHASLNSSYIPRNHLFLPASTSRNYEVMANFSTKLMNLLFYKYGLEFDNDTLYFSYLRLLSLANSSLCSVVLSLQYVNLIVKYQPSMLLGTNSAYKLFVVGLILANKFIEDQTYTNTGWSEVSNLKLRLINHLEITFLSILNYQLNIPTVLYYRWIKQTISILEYEEACMFVENMLLPKTVLDMFVKQAYTNLDVAALDEVCSKPPNTAYNLYPNQKYIIPHQILQSNVPLEGMARPFKELSTFNHTNNQNHYNFQNNFGNSKHDSSYNDCYYNNANLARV